MFDFRGDRAFKQNKTHEGILPQEIPTDLAVIRAIRISGGEWV